MAAQTCTVTWSLVDQSGNPVQGDVVFSPQADDVDGTVVQPVRAPFVNGSISVQLPASVNGTTYQVAPLLMGPGFDGQTRPISGDLDDAFLITIAPGQPVDLQAARTNAVAATATTTSGSTSLSTTDMTVGP